ncbi:pilus assembly protein [Hydrocarboniphaga sp.]|uniref:pilus assembly protein n=1 Tax=Hydrocarboniphaga sp. TaxID=2033016 RepID=UPI003D0ACDE6
MNSTLRHRLLAAFLGLFICFTLAVETEKARADDIEIYTNPAANSVKPPYTVIVLDLNLLGICNSVLTQTSNPNNPDSPQLCLNITNTIVLSDLLGGLTSNPTAFLTSLLVGSYTCTTPTTCSSSANALCDLYGLLGLVAPVIPIPGISYLLSLVLGGVTTLTCSTLSFLLSVPLVGSILNGLMSGFVGQLIAGLISPLLSTVVGALPSAIIGLLQSTFSGVLNLGQVGLIGLLENILNNLINTNVAIMVSHADRSNATGSPASSCAFADLASIPGARRTTSGCSNGAYMLLGFTSLVDTGTVSTVLTKVGSLLTNMLSPTNLLNSTTALLSTALTTPTQLLPPYQGKEVYAELAHYLAGNDIYNAPLARWDGLTGLLTRDTTIELSNGNYSKPALECRTANVLNIMLTNNIRDSESDATLRSYFPGLPSGAITLSNVVTQAANPGFTDNAGNTIQLRSFFLIQNLLTSMSTLANAGATVLSYVDSLGLLGLGQTAATLLKPVIDVDASLVTPSLTVDLTQPSAVRPEAFFAEFKPDLSQKPRWNGNLKRLRVATDSSGNYQYYDANGALAIASDGRIKTSALTYWTNTSLLGSGVSADGRSSTLGGAGQKIPGYLFAGGGDPGRVNSDAKRTLYYDKITATSFAINGLDADTQAVRDELKTDLGVTGTTTADDTLRRQLLLYARGFNVGTAATPLGTGATVTGVTARSWMHGALLHSRPVAINYGARGSFTASSPDIRVVYGAADGFMRMVRNSDGVENWGFMPRPVMAQQSVLRENTSVPGLPYGVDGAPAVLLQDRSSSGGAADGVIDSGNSNDRAWMFFGLRRSGRYYYGMNLTNPDSPSLMWRIGPDGLYKSSGLVASSSTLYAELGLTLSNPQIGRMSVTEGTTTTTKPVVIFAGGYNGGVTSGGTKLGKDYNRGSDGRVGTDDSVGNAIYIVDAQTGDLLWKAVQGSYSSSTPFNATTKAFAHPLLTNSIPSDVTIVDSDGDGLTDRLYVGDTGGRLWRGDFPGADRTKWTLSPIASLGRHRTSNVANDRRFFQAPDYAPYRGTTGNFDMVTFGSGDREDPLNVTTENYFYAYRDNRTASGLAAASVVTTDAALKGQADFTDLTTTCASASTVSCAATSDLSTGWKVKLAGSGEKVLSQPLSASGTAFFATYTPPGSAQSCTPSEGTSKVYGLALSDSRPTVASFINDGDGSQRSQASTTPGLPGEFNTLTANALAQNASTLKLDTTPAYTIYWRERRGDEETKP